MSMTITLSGDLAQKLQTQARKRQQSLDMFVADLLARVVEPWETEWPTVEQVVAKIRSARYAPDNFYPATESLVALLGNAPADPAFDLDEWEREWAKAESEIKAITRANALAEGLG